MDYTIASIKLIHSDNIYISYNASGNKYYIVIQYGDKYWISGRMDREPAKKAFNYYIDKIMLDGCGIDIDSMNKDKKQYKKRRLKKCIAQRKQKQYKIN